MKALSIRQPWAWLIVRPDLTDAAARAAAVDAMKIKDIENRQWPTRVRGFIYVHAAKGMTRNEYEAAKACAADNGVTLPAFDQLERGGIIGEVCIVDCVEQSDSPWFFGDYGFVLRNSKPLPFVPLRGALGFFEVPNTPTKDPQ